MKLDYESRVPRARRGDLPGAADVLLWMACCVGGAAAGIGLVAIVAADPLPIVAIGPCGLAGGSCNPPQHAGQCN